MYLIRTAWLTLTLAACAGGTAPVAETPVPDPAAEPAAEPAPVAATESASELEDYAEKLAMHLNELDEVDAGRFSEGDFERNTKGFRKGTAMLFIIDEHSVGEYGRTTMTYALKDGAVVEWTRSGFAHEPTPDNDMRFVYFDEEVLMSTDGDVLRSRRRQKEGSSSGLEMDLADAPWADIEAPKEDIDLDDAMARFAAGSGADAPH